jgi:DNA-binding NarL/FixJ family response regulator
LWHLEGLTKPAASDSEKTRKALLVDRHPLWLDAVERLFSKLGFTVLGKLRSAEQAIAAMVEAPPEVLVTDLDTEDGPMTGIRAIQAATEVAPDAAVIVLSARDEPEALQSAFDAGASAYVLKSVSPDDLAVAAGQVAERSVYTALPAGRAAETVIDPGDTNPLTPRELEVLGLAAEGRSNAVIADALRITEQTVKLHLSNTYRKLGAGNRTEASHRATAMGLLPPGPSGEVDAHVSASLESGGGQRGDLR